MRGPIVYCLESHDNRGRVRDVWLPERASITSDWRSELLGGVTILRAAAQRLPLGDGKPVETEVVAIPYYANANRGPAEMIVIMEELGRALVVEPFLSTAVIATGLLARSGAPADAALLRGIVAGDVVAAFAFAEPHARYDWRDLATTARKNGSGYVLNGRK